MVRINPTVIEGSLQKAKAAIKEYAQVGGKRISQETGTLQTTTVKQRGTWNSVFGLFKNKNNRELITVEEQLNSKRPEMVTARDMFVSTKNGRKVKGLYYSQFMSETGEAIIFPAKKGFLGIGKRKASFEVAQNQARYVNNCDNMILQGTGTIENPENCKLLIKNASGKYDEVLLNAEQAKEFINNVKNGKDMIKESYLTANLRHWA